MSDSKIIGVDVSHWNTYKKKKGPPYMPFMAIHL